MRLYRTSLGTRVKKPSKRVTGGPSTPPASCNHGARQPQTIEVGLDRCLAHEGLTDGCSAGALAHLDSAHAPR